VNSLSRAIISVVIFSFVAYLTIGLSLAVVPVYVQSLGFSPLWSGIAISIQYVATFFSRGPAGRMSDTRGPKQTVLVGLVITGISGIFSWGAARGPSPEISLALQLIARLILGVGESCIATAAILWGIGRVGKTHTARVISWNGIATYSALAIGAPLGLVVDRQFGFAGLGWFVVGVSWLAIPFALAQTATAPLGGKPLPFHRVFGKVLPFGTGLALGSIGFGSIATFIVLYFSSRSWPYAAFCLTTFGTAFIAVRLFFSSTIDRKGGARVAKFCFFFESLGLFLLWSADSMPLALAGATLTGIGFSLVFPALAVEAMEQVSAENRGAALAMYSVFVDLSLGVTGPLGGWIAGVQGFRTIFLFAAICSVLGIGLTLRLRPPLRG